MDSLPTNQPFRPRNADQAWQIIEAQLQFLKQRPYASPDEIQEFTREVVAQMGFVN